MITPCSAASDAPLCFSPLPELASLRTSTTRFSVGHVVDNADTVLVPNTTNAYGINITFDVSALLNHPRAVPTTSAEAGATLAVGIFHDASAAAGTSLPAVCYGHRGTPTWPVGCPKALRAQHCGCGHVSVLPWWP